MKPIWLYATTSGVVGLLSVHELVSHGLDDWRWFLRCTPLLCYSCGNTNVSGVLFYIIWSMWLPDPRQGPKEIARHKTVVPNLFAISLSHLSINIARIEEFFQILYLLFTFFVQGCKCRVKISSSRSTCHS